MAEQRSTVADVTDLRGSASGAVGGMDAVARMLREGRIPPEVAANQLDRISGELRAAVRADFQRQFPGVEIR